MIEKVLLITSGLSLALNVQADNEVYKYVDEEGNVTYTFSPLVPAVGEKVTKLKLHSLPPAAESGKTDAGAVTEKSSTEGSGQSLDSSPSPSTANGRATSNGSKVVTDNYPDKKTTDQALPRPSINSSASSPHLETEPRFESVVLEPDQPLE
jgi:hypothetical protein